MARRWNDLGLKGSLLTEATLEPEAVVQLVVADQMSMDPSKKSGQNSMKKQIALRTGYHLKR